MTKAHGIIYRSGGLRRHGSKALVPSFVASFTYHLLRNIGAGMVGFAVMGFLFTYGPAVKTELNYAVNTPEPSETSKLKKVSTDNIKVAHAEEVEAVQKEAESYGINSYFSLAIPAIGAYSNIVANVDATDKYEYMEALKTGIAHARGSYFPGQGKHIFLFAHSTDSPVNVIRYNAVFYLLRKLEEGDRISVFFSDRKYEYVVDRKVITDATDVSWLTESGRTEKLILQTCHPPGTTWKRLIVVAVPVVES